MENALGIMEAALRVRTALAEVMAGNIANADTPGYTAKTMDFNAALSAALENDSRGSYDAKRITAENIRYDRNDVDQQQELGRYSDNALMYLSTMRLYRDSIARLKEAEETR